LYIKLLTDRQTDRQTNARYYVTLALAETINRANDVNNQKFTSDKKSVCFRQRSFSVQSRYVTIDWLLEFVNVICILVLLTWTSANNSSNDSA